jgi:hypothetical protein
MEVVMPAAMQAKTKVGAKVAERTNFVTVVVMRSQIEIERVGAAR